MCRQHVPIMPMHYDSWCKKLPTAASHLCTVVVGSNTASARAVTEARVMISYLVYVCFIVCLCLSFHLYMYVCLSVCPSVCLSVSAMQPWADTLLMTSSTVPCIAFPADLPQRTLKPHTVHSAGQHQFGRTQQQQQQQLQHRPGVLSGTYATAARQTSAGVNNNLGRSSQGASNSRGNHRQDLSQTSTAAALTRVHGYPNLRQVQRPNRA